MITTESNDNDQNNKTSAKTQLNLYKLCTEYNSQGSGSAI